MRKKIVVGIGLAILALAAAFVLWASITNPLMPSAQAALESGAGVRIETPEEGVAGWLAFLPADSEPRTGLVFYPGGRVNYRAYAPYAAAVARQGYLVVIVRMLLNLAVLDINAAARVQDAYPQIEHWAVGGHSLGGAMAAEYAAGNIAGPEGLVLLAAYPAGSTDLSASSLRVVSIYGSDDGIADLETVAASRALLPADARFVEIAGGNHAQFGDYGGQSGDNPAGITRSEQQRLAVAATVELLASLEE